jgi:hypothetical protein
MGSADREAATESLQLNDETVDSIEERVRGWATPS